MGKAAKSFVQGHAPKVAIKENPKKDSKEVEGATVQKLLGISDEQLKYQKCWNVDDYRNVSPGEKIVPMFLDALTSFKEKDLQKMDLVDIGCGTGRGGHKLWETLGIDTTLMDFAPNCLDENVQTLVDDESVESLRFVQHDITKKSKLRYSLGYCTDVMEHLPPEQIDDALTTIFEMCSNVFFQISTQPDYFGGHPDIGEDLHLTVWNYQQWLKKFAEFGVTVHRSFEGRHHVVFFVSGYCGFALDKLQMNTSPEIIWANMRENSQLGLKQVTVFEEQPDQKVVLLAGGPSLNNYVDEIKEHKKNGAKIVTVNNTHDWAKEHDLWPVNQVMIDARPFNRRFVESASEENTYFMCSQVDPEIVKSLPPEKTYLFQGNLDPSSIEIIRSEVGEMYEDWFPIPGGSTVTLRALSLLVTLGFRDVEVYGFDSCLMGKPVEKVEWRSRELNGVDYSSHHAYDQPENDIKNHDDVTVCTVAGGSFGVNAWMLAQAMEFFSYGLQVQLKPLTLKVHGDGLIAHCLEQGLEHIGPMDVKEET